MVSHYRFHLAAAALIIVLGAVQVSTMLGETQTWDEGMHLVAGYSYLAAQDYHFNPEHPALAKMLCALPLLPLRPNLDPAWLKKEELDAGYDFIYHNRYTPDLILGVARSSTVLLTLLFAVSIAWWTRRHFGDAAALIALALLCFDPNIIAHGRYITTDVPAAFFIFLATALWIDYLEEPTRARLLCAGLALGGAIGSKYSALFLVPLVMLSGVFKGRWRGALAAVAIAVALVATIYEPEIAHSSAAPRLYENLDGRGVFARHLLSMGKIFQLPRLSYLAGINEIGVHNAGGHPAYLMGKFSETGWWYYFPVAILVKTPLASLAAMAVGLALFWQRMDKRFVVWSLFAVAVVFLCFCMTSHINIGHRHVLPLYAFLYVLAGVVLSRWRWPAMALLAVLAFESLSIYPDYLAFFNRAAGGPANGPRYLLDSNIDWGQDVKKLGRYMKQNHIDRLCFSFFGHTDYVRYGVETYQFPMPKEACDAFAAVSVTPLFGLYQNPEDWAAIRRMTPVARIGYSIYVYDLRKKK